MSTTASTHADQSHCPSSDLGIPADKAFDEIAFHNPTTCSRCFAHIRRYDTFRPDATAGVSKYAPEERYIRAFDGEQGYADEPFDTYGYRPFKRPRTFCGECGSKSGRADDESLSKPQALTFADQLVDRLREVDISVNQQVLKYVVGSLKERAACRNYDTEIFRRSTKVAIRHARR